MQLDLFIEKKKLKPYVYVLPHKLSSQSFLQRPADHDIATCEVVIVLITRYYDLQN